MMSQGCRCAADVQLRNYRYYLKLKWNMFGAGGVPQHDESKIWMQYDNEKTDH